MDTSRETAKIDRLDSHPKLLNRKQRRAAERQNEKAKKKGNNVGGKALIKNVQEKIGLTDSEMSQLQSNLKNPEVVNNLSYENQGDIIPMTRDNIMLFEKIDENQGGKVTEVFTDPNDDSSKVYSIKGYKIWVIYDNDSKEITHYDNTADHTDLGCLEGKEGHYLCCVDKNEYGQHVWNCFVINKYFSNEMVSIADGRPCTEEEITLLNTVYPEYFNNAY